jgi:hypothetical protein
MPQPEISFRTVSLQAGYLLCGVSDTAHQVSDTAHQIMDEA